MVWDGVRRTEDSDKVEGYLLANRSLPWWAVGLSVMATQLSAITLVGATGQGYADGMRFVQFYFGLPIAMIILCVTLVPFFYRARVYTAYEYLERRFDLKTRTLASVLFLCSRGLSCGVIIAAPAVILSIILGWNLTLTILAIGLPTAIYTMVGGVQAVTWTDVKQMVVIVVGLVAVVVVLILGLPGDVSVRRGAARGRRRRAAEGGRLPLRLDADLHVLVGPARRAVPDAVVLRLRSEPGAALPDGEVGGGRARLADDERLRQDPAAGAGAADRRAGVRLLSVPAAADAVQPGARGEDRDERARGRVPAARDRVRRGVRGPAQRRRGARRRRRRSGRARRARRFRTRPTREVSAIRAPGRAARARGDRRRELPGSHRRHARSRRQLRVSDVRDDPAADRPGRA